MSRTHLFLAATAVIAATLLVVTMRRVPTPTYDSEFYTSIARSEQLHGSGIPSSTRYSPVAVDHIDFYGPVYFRLVAASFTWFGVTIRSVRLVSLTGAFLVVIAGALLADAISGRPWRWLWAATLVLLTPEIRAWATAGTMATLAVGWEMLALAVFVRGLSARRGRVWYGPGAGLLLTFAALTTPRTYPFIGAFLAAGVALPWMMRDSASRAWRQMAATVATLAAGVGAWAIASHGDPLHWARYMTFILTHEDTDVALLPSADRQWLFSIGNAATLLIASTGAIVAAWLLSRRNAPRTVERAGMAAFALLVGWIAFVGAAVSMNLTFAQEAYMALPLFIAVLAAPCEMLGVNRRTLAVAASVVLSVEMGIAGVWYARVAATWSAHDRDTLREFFRAHVPEGSAVVGPQAPYLLAVESTGSRYRTISPASWADWARWVPVVEPEAVADARRVPITKTGARYFVWRADLDLPDAYECVKPQAVAIYEPAPHHLDLLGWLGERTWDAGYPKSILYRLPPHCPMGYDPTQS